ncbi:helix-turn-helix transcriptional regulator, partial [Escherichia coli]
MALRGAPRSQNGEIRKDGAVARPNRQAQRREEILEAAITLIERHDLATLRIADVAAELGLTPNAVRYYFR